MFDQFAPTMISEKFIKTVDWYSIGKLLVASDSHWQPMLTNPVFVIGNFIYGLLLTWFFMQVVVFNHFQARKQKYLQHKWSRLMF